MPPLVGSFADVAIETREQQPLVELPRKALRQQDEVWVVDDEGRLDIRELDVRWGARASPTATA